MDTTKLDRATEALAEMADAMQRPDGLPPNADVDWARPIVSSLARGAYRLYWLAVVHCDDNDAWLVKRLCQPFLDVQALLAASVAWFDDDAPLVVSLVATDPASIAGQFALAVQGHPRPPLGSSQPADPAAPLWTVALGVAAVADVLGALPAESLASVGDRDAARTLLLSAYDELAALAERREASADSAPAAGVVEDEKADPVEAPRPARWWRRVLDRRGSMLLGAALGSSGLLQLVMCLLDLRGLPVPAVLPWTVGVVLVLGLVIGADVLCQIARRAGAPVASRDRSGPTDAKEAQQ